MRCTAPLYLSPPTLASPAHGVAQLVEVVGDDVSLLGVRVKRSQLGLHVLGLRCVPVRCTCDRAEGVQLTVGYQRGEAGRCVHTDGSHEKKKLCILMRFAVHTQCDTYSRRVFRMDSRALE